MDRSEALQNMLAIIYEIYDASGRAHGKETL